MDEITTKLRNCELAREALTDANGIMKAAAERREVAVNAMIDYALHAYVSGEKLDDIMDAVEFKQGDTAAGMPAPLAALFGMSEGGGSRVEQFASWLGRGLSERIVERHEEEEGTDGS